MIIIHNKPYVCGYTHGGKFHSDDVLATAILRILDPEFPVERGYNPPTSEGILLFDIGGGSFDHHTEPKACRPETGIPYCAFSKLWQVLGDQFGLDEEGRSRFDREFCLPVDLTDNLGKRNPLSTLIAAMNPLWDEEADSDLLFWQAEALCEKMLRRWLETEYAAQRAKAAAKALAENAEAHIVVTERYIPARCFEDGVFFLIYPSQRGGWQAMAVPQKSGLRVCFPAGWHGRPENYPEGMTFCHSGGFLASFENREYALRVCRQCAAALIQEGAAIGGIP